MKVGVVGYQGAGHRLSGIGTALVLTDKHKHKDKHLPGRNKATQGCIRVPFACCSKKSSTNASLQRTVRT